MEVIIVIGIIIFLIWLFSGNSSNKTSTHTPSSSSTTTSKPIDTASTMASYYYDIAWKAGEEGKHSEAIENYNRAISYMPSAIYNNNRAFSKSKVNDYKGAIEDYSKAIQLAPNKALYWLNRGFTHNNNDKDELACRDWKKAAELGSEKAKEMLEKYCKPKTTTRQSNTLTQNVNRPQSRAIVNNNDAILNQYQIAYLYHMTHKGNLENILRSGLLSHNEAHRGLNQIDIADNEVNTRRRKREPIFNRSIHDYVPLYFNPKNPMLYRRKNIQNDIVIIAIDRNLLLSQNVLFTDGNAASQKTSFYNSINNLNRLNWQCIRDEYWNDYQDGKRIKCAEVLVYPKIEVSSIKKIICNNQVTLNFVRTKIRAYSSIASEVNNNLYFNSGDSFYIKIENEPLDDLPF
jgi:tetratricopeptide (TPR) repeat protein